MSLQKEYLKPEILTKINNLELRAKLVVEGFITGLHQSPFHGFSVEFAQHRPYNIGDNLRYVDWKVLGRTDRYYIKQYEEETNLKAYILLDTSRSMDFSSGGITKLMYAKYFGAALAYLMISQRDAVGLALFGETVKKMLPPRSATSYLQPILLEMDGAQPEGETDISSILHQLAERLKRRGLIILISDLFDQPEKVLSGLRHFRHGHHEVLIFQILDKNEIDFDFRGNVEFEDMETGEHIRTYPWYIRQEYRQAMEEFITFYKKNCRDNRIDYRLLRTDEPLDKGLMEFLIKRTRMY